MVNAGAIATTSLIPGASADTKWQLIYGGLSEFAGRPLSLNDPVYASATETNFRNRSIAGLLSFEWRTSQTLLKQPTCTPHSAR